MGNIVIKQLELGQLKANAYLIWREGRTDCMVIDPGDDIGPIEAELAASGRTLTDILLTHGHFDHILGVAPLVQKYGAHVHIHPGDALKLRSPGKALYASMWCDLPFVPVEADMPFPDGDEDWTIEVCGVLFTGFRTPGHTPGSVCLLNEESKSLFTGDTLFAYSYGRTDFYDGSAKDMNESLLRLMKMDRSLTVYSGHGEADVMDSIARRWGM